MRTLLRLLSFLAILVSFFVFVAISVGIIRFFWGSRTGHTDRVEVIDLSGIIVSSSRLLAEIQDHEKDDRVKAVVVRINSPGGLVAPSQEIYSALARLDSQKPVLASLGAVAASGGYYSALGARKIFASPGTLTASIGVIMEFANTQKLYQWAKVERYSLKAGKFKDLGSPLREMTKDERTLLETMLNDIHLQFIEAVKSRRNLSDAQLSVAADGRIMTGQQAFDIKLIDELGGIEQAVREAKKLAGLPEDAPVNYPATKRGLLRKLLLGDDGPEEHTSVLGKFTEFFSAPPREGYRFLLLAPLG